MRSGQSCDHVDESRCVRVTGVLIERFVVNLVDEENVQRHIFTINVGSHVVGSSARLVGVLTGLVVALCV
jgi:hypothetical protein